MFIHKCLAPWKKYFWRAGIRKKAHHINLSFIMRHIAFTFKNFLLSRKYFSFTFFLLQPSINGPPRKSNVAYKVSERNRRIYVQLMAMVMKSVSEENKFSTCFQYASRKKNCTWLGTWLKMEEEEMNENAELQENNQLIERVLVCK